MASSRNLLSHDSVASQKKQLQEKAVNMSIFTLFFKHLKHHREKNREYTVAFDLQRGPLL